MKKLLLGGVALSGIAGFSPAYAGGNIFLTGHDDDYHATVSGDFHTSPGIGPQEQLDAALAFVRAGAGANSSLPVLAIDNGSELTGALTNAGVAFTAKTVGAVNAADFDPTKYSAFVVASVVDCGGCDNPVGTGTTLSAFNTAIASFFNAGGGILGLTASDDAAGFAYVPDAASGTPIGHLSGFAATVNGKADITGFDAVNGDETHNIFTTLAPAYQIAEVDASGLPGTTLPNGSPAPVSVYVKNGTITCTAPAGCTISAGVPEPASMAMLGAGLFGLGLVRRRRRS